MARAGGIDLKVLLLQLGIGSRSINLVDGEYC